ncbi:MAG: 3-deoxy-D-manno-octulosonic acid transferase [Proteobacteria bacterium]|nr:3-deoxy-D-manno-octulosonic acid transferase [Pseudomonadota bacterium]
MAAGAFGAYRLIGTAATPLVRRHLRRRVGRGREDAARLAERFGHPGIARPAGPLIWIHGASVGESLSALPLVARIREDWPGLNLLMTTGTVTSARLMAERLPEGVIHQYAPVDLPAAVRRFLAHWRPALGLIVESEFWPNLLLQARAQGVALALVNGRMSAASYASWRRVRPLIGHLLGQFEVTLAQSREDEAHLRDLGAAAPLDLGNLKFAAPPPAANPDQLAALEAAFGPRPRWLAASTHPGEEEIVAEVHARLAARTPDLLTVLVPRHPDRGPAIAEALAARGLEVVLRSSGRPIAPETAVYLADSIGEMGLWYRLCQVVFVGGSLIPKGGQNLLEPAKLGCAIICGPHMTNFLRVTEEMGRVDALRRVADAEQLAAAVSWLLEDEPARAGMIRAAGDYAGTQAGALDRIVAALKPQLDRAAAGDTTICPNA